MRPPGTRARLQKLVARRPATIDPLLQELRAEIAHRLRLLPAPPSRDFERRRSPRVEVNRPARFRVGDLLLHGQVRDVGMSGLFLRSDLLVEIGERGQVEVDGLAPVPGRVVWIRPPSHALGSGFGISFELRDASKERRILELILALLDTI